MQHERQLGMQVEDLPDPAGLLLAAGGVPSRSRSSTGPIGKPRCRRNATRNACRFQGLDET